MEFKQSPVIFDEDSHSYQLDGKKLLGITGLIHSVLGLGVYPEADDYVKDFIIPRAGSRGTAIHHAIQTYDQIGIMQTNQVVRTRYGCEKRGNVQYVDEEWDVSQELGNYIRHLTAGGFRPLANELTVSDNVRYASQIDNVWQRIDIEGIWLVDTKSNNIDLYPLCGYYNANYFTSGEEALRELEKARVFDPLGHAGLTPLGKIRLTLAGEIKMTPVEASAGEFFCSFGDPSPGTAGVYLKTLQI